MNIIHRGNLPALDGGAFDETPMTPKELVGQWISDLGSESTVAAYSSALRAFATFVEAESVVSAVESLLAMKAASKLMRRWVIRMKDEEGLASSTINTRLSAIRSLIEYADMCEIPVPHLRVRNVPSVPVRDMTGPNVAEMAALLRAAKAQSDPLLAARDECIMRILIAMGLREMEIARLTIGDVDFRRTRLNVRRKGKTGGAEPTTAPKALMPALSRWINLSASLEGRSTEPDNPLFCQLSPSRSVSRYRQFSPKTVARIVERISALAGIPETTPHRIRHGALTAARNLKHEKRAVARWASHSEKMTEYYDDQANLGSEIADSLMSAIELDQSA